MSNDADRDLEGKRGIAGAAQHEETRARLLDDLVSSGPANSKAEQNDKVWIC